MTARHKPYSGTLFINEATQELFTLVYAVDDMTVCIAHGGTTCDPKRIIIDFDAFDEYRGSGGPSVGCCLTNLYYPRNRAIVILSSVSLPGTL